MHDDPATAVRLRVIQVAAKMDTPESQALLERHTRDTDAIVRGEAIRLLKLREDNSAR